MNVSFWVKDLSDGVGDVDWRLMEGGEVEQR